MITLKRNNLIGKASNILSHNEATCCSCLYAVQLIIGNKSASNHKMIQVPGAVKLYQKFHNYKLYSDKILLFLAVCSSAGLYTLALLL